MIDITIDTSEAESVLGKLTQKLQGLRPLMERIQPILEEEIRETFDTERDPSGSPWASLSPFTLRQKQRLGYPSQKLVRTGRGRATAMVLVLGDRLQIQHEDYMRHHMTGTGKMPKRRFAPEQVDVESGALADAIQAEVEAYLDPGLGRFVRGEVVRLFRR